MTAIQTHPEIDLRSEAGKGDRHPSGKRGRVDCCTAALSARTNTQRFCGPFHAPAPSIHFEQGFKVSPDTIRRLLADVDRLVKKCEINPQAVAPV
jgi:hypothetical protein